MHRTSIVIAVVAIIVATLLNATAAGREIASSIVQGLSSVASILGEVSR